MNPGNWIWLDSTAFPELQQTKATAFDTSEAPYAVVCFRKEYRFSSEVCDLHFLASGDCRYRLFLNGAFCGMGPAFAGGDWGRTEPMPQRYADEYTVSGVEGRLLFEAEVQLPPTLLCDISSGQGGFYLRGEANFPEGSKVPFGTDETWQCRIDRRRITDLFYDASVPVPPWNRAKIIRRPLPLPSEIPVNETEFLPISERGELEKIVAGTICCEIDADGPFELRLTPFETQDLEDACEIIRGNTSLSYEGFRIRSVGGIRAEIMSGTPRIRQLGVRAAKYPGKPVGECLTGWKEIDHVLDVCEHTLSICRQSIHLDSPRHMEPLGCTGDYWIESLMEYFCFDDHRLTRFDIIRTARLLKATGGVMFHTGYSLMWISMLHDYILYTGDRTVLAETEESMRILLRRFETYEDETGILDTPPNYMFADWVEIAGYSMHHPPKALGQTILNALYYRALRTAGLLLRDAFYERKASALQTAFDHAFWDASSALYLSGKTGLTPVNEWLPQNAQKPIFTLHANIMAVSCGICHGERAAAVVKAVLTDTSLPDYQPYFAHFVFQALWNTGLFDEFAEPILKRWIPVTEACSKGLAEGWIRPCDNYVFDHSHAWGGCPRYWLPRALLGLEILEPGFRRISLHPRLKLTGRASISLSTPFGMLRCTATDGIIETLSVPPEVQIV